MASQVPPVNALPLEVYGASDAINQASIQRLFNTFGLRCCILAGVMAVAANAQKPDAAEQSRALAALRDYALNYTGKMPDFTCTQITQRTYYPNIDLRERPQHDAIEEQITYASHKESYKVIKVNGGRN